MHITFVEIFDEFMFNLFDRWRSTEEDEWFERLFDKAGQSHLDFLVATSLPDDLCKRFNDEWISFDGPPKEAFDYEKDWRNADEEWRDVFRRERERAWVNIVRKIKRDELSALKNISEAEIRENFKLDNSCDHYAFGSGHLRYAASYRLVAEYAKHRELLAKEARRFERASRQWSFIKDKFGFWIAAYAAVISTLLLFWRVFWSS
ncbi:MAG: hypothetical protein ACX939_01475 [Hyphococcus sp.]